MIDFARIKIIAGDGGQGTGSFAHVKGKRRGKADGGDGGRGGDVYLVAGAHVNTLEAFRYNKEYKGHKGENGLSKLRKGAQGQDLEVKVPLGTQAKLSDGSLYEILNKTDRVLVARGGEGGKGNAHLRDDLGRRPLRGELGQVGEKVEIELELKLIADVGLIGFPNAGKSTLISALTAAKPKIADYPFTTLEPNLGVLDLDNRLSTIDNRRVVIADIPGLIEGASDGKGLGVLFLRHIERTKILVHLIDITSSDVWKDYQSIRGELKLYSGALSKKKEIIVLNKIDLVGSEFSLSQANVFKSHRKKVFLISSTNREGVGALVKEIIKKI